VITQPACSGVEHARPAMILLPFALLLVAGHLSLPVTVMAGECVDATSASSIIAALADADPDDLSHEAKYILGCLSFPVSSLSNRFPRYLPSWRLLRNTRRDFRDLGRNRDLVQSLERMTSSRDSHVRTWASRALALYGQAAYHDSLKAASLNPADLAMFLAVLGDSSGVAPATRAYADADRKAALLDALYYQSTAAAIAFIRHVARDGSDMAMRERARWMLQNPMPVKDAWKL
jgi:hypothetical protein